MKLKTDIQWNETYRDSVTGFEGKATAIYFYLNGCERVLLEPPFNPDKKIEPETFDAPRLVHVESNKKATSTRTGGWQPEPTPRREP